MNANSIANSKYTYIHNLKYPPRAVGVHQIEVQGRGAKAIVLPILIAIIFSHYGCAVLLKVQSSPYTLLSLLFGALLIMLFGRKRVVRESAVIMPTLGVQLETLYKRWQRSPLKGHLFRATSKPLLFSFGKLCPYSGKVVRRFVPADVILKPVLQECVTPVTHYCNLSLLLRGQEELTLVFKVVHPQLEMSIPIRKILCTVSDSICSETSREEGNGDN